MIYCHKCKTQNSSNATICSKCGTNLLPGNKIGKRVGCAVVGLVLGVSFAAFYIYLITTKGADKDFVLSTLILVFIALILIIIGIYQAIKASKKTPDIERYRKRAERHIELDPKQSIEDYSMVLELSPPDIFTLGKRAEIFNKLGMANEAKKDWQESLRIVNKILSSSTERSYEDATLIKRDVLYEKLGIEDESVLDRLNYTYTEEKKLPVIGLAMGAIEGIKKGTVDARRMDMILLRKELMSDGRWKAVGYCPECKALVNFDYLLNCTDSHRMHPRPTDIFFTKTS